MIPRPLRTLYRRLQEHEQSHLLADIGETVELWLTSGLLPLPTRLDTRMREIGEWVGERARKTRPPPRDVPAPLYEAPSARRPAEAAEPTPSAVASTGLASQATADTPVCREQAEAFIGTTEVAGPGGVGPGDGDENWRAHIAEATGR